MTLEQEQFFGGCWNSAGKRELLNRILRKLGDQGPPGAFYGQQYFQNLYRRNVSGHTLKSAFSPIHEFLVFLQKHGKPHPSSLTQEDLEAFVESQQDRGLKPRSVSSNLRQVQTFLRYLIAGGIVTSDILARPIRL